VIFVQNERAACLYPDTIFVLMNPTFVNIAGYKFVSLNDIPNLKSMLLPRCRELELKGTILLSLEGINLFLAGSRESVDEFLAELRQLEPFADFEVKESLSDHQPFNRMLVRLKKEIISMGVDSIVPEQRTSPKLKATELKQWLDQGKPVTLLDVRNDYEVEVGTFENATPIGIDHFRKFPDAVNRLPVEVKENPIVMFCTGGIRCEKAGPLMEEKGFQNVFQLDGGILKYFQECGGDHYEGDCFVFDQRVAVDPDLQETDTTQCYACQAVLTVEDQKSPLYKPPNGCPSCYSSPDQERSERMTDLNQQLTLATTPLPGSQPYDNVRPMNVPLRFDHQPVIDFLLGMHTQLGREFWQKSCDEGRVRYKQRPLSADESVRSGWRVEHWVPQTVEPDVSNEVGFLYEDDAILVVDKPAPLPMHPSGRFNRNTLVNFLKLAYPAAQLRTVHRLDANTTGVLVLAKKRTVAAALSPQFVNNQVEKVYLAKIDGHPSDRSFQCDDPISSKASSVAGARTIDESGLPSETRFTVLQRLDDGTSLVECRPVTGRTNQIRLHLGHLGFPIVGDTVYDSGQAATGQTRSLNSPPMCLHALRLTINHPISGDSMSFEAPAPKWAECQSGV
jgi:RluA family pseudouridine synthase